MSEINEGPVNPRAAASCIGLVEMQVIVDFIAAEEMGSSFLERIASLEYEDVLRERYARLPWITGQAHPDSEAV